MSAIVVSADYEGLRQAALEMFVEQSEAEREQPEGIEPEQLAEARPSRRTLSPGYYDRVHYLNELHMLMEVGIRMDASDVTIAEVRGLRALRAARMQFEREFPACPKCGTHNERVRSFTCSGCGHQLIKVGANN